MYRGRKTDSSPNPISWKKKPSRHIAKEPFQSKIKTFSHISSISEDFHKPLIERWSVFLTLAWRLSAMAKFKVIVSDPTEGTSKVVELEEAIAAPLIGKRIGDVIDGTIIDLAGQKVQVTGGSDRDGFPMRPSVHGGVRRKIVLAGGVGFNPVNEGMRRRKTIRGNVITDEIVQINMKVTGKPEPTEEENKIKSKRKKPAAEKEAKTEEKPATESQKANI